MKKDHVIVKIIPVMLAFFTMGFVDLIGIATNYVKNDFGLSDTVANSFSIVVFIWFLVFSIPTGILMNKIGRKLTVLLSLAVTFAGLLFPLVMYSKLVMMLSFSFLGIGNTLMQVSLNPLLTDIVSEKKLPSYLTMGQFIKAIASFVAPIIAAQAIILWGNWKLLFPIFAVICLIAMIYLLFTDISEQTADRKSSSFLKCFALLSDGVVIMLFTGILVHVGIDVGMNITAPKLLIEREGMTLSQAGYATSIYFLFRTFGCFAGSFFLARLSIKRVFIVSVLLILAGITGFYVSNHTTAIYACIALVGIGNSNVFPIIFSNALSLTAQKNEMSGLMVMGIAGGAIFPVLMGFASDSMGSQTGAVIVLTVCVAYLVFLVSKIKASGQ
ncbi:MAG: MFS transporter [Dysgonamonadaceae bacterium]|jgi:fucose permease|nr:MFS transporter [Dysgonamonadaceae bacterium]